MKTVAVIGTFDSKGEEFSFLCECIRRGGALPYTIDVGTKGPPAFSPDVTAEEVAACAGADLRRLRETNDPAACMAAEAGGLPVLLKRLTAEGKIQGAVAMGGGQGTSVLRVGLAALPIGMSKILVTTMAGGGNKLLGGVNDTHIVDSVVDFSGLNDILKPIIAQAGAAAAAMAGVEREAPSGRVRVASSMFGQTTPCVDACRHILTEAGYDFYPFHANGMGGPNMEALIAQGFFDAVLDITTTELLQDMVCPGSGCRDRLEAAGRMGLPQIVVPGALDSTNVFFTEKDRFPNRRFCRHNAEVFLMRARAEDEREVGRLLADKLNRAKGKVVVVIPMGGFSRLSESLPDPEADQALLETLKAELNPEIRIVECPQRINDPAFAQQLCRIFMELVPAGRA